MGSAGRQLLWHLKNISEYSVHANSYSRQVNPMRNTTAAFISSKLPHGHTRQCFGSTFLHVSGMAAISSSRLAHGHTRHGLGGVFLHVSAFYNIRRFIAERMVRIKHSSGFRRYSGDSNGIERDLCNHVRIDIRKGTFLNCKRYNEHITPDSTHSYLKSDAFNIFSDSYRVWSGGCTGEDEDFHSSCAARRFSKMMPDPRNIKVNEFDGKGNREHIFFRTRIASKRSPVMKKYGSETDICILGAVWRLAQSRNVCSRLFHVFSKAK